MTILIFVLLSICWKICVCCPTDEGNHSLFFMSIGFDGQPENFIEPSNLCIRDCVNCSYELNKVYRAVSNKDVYAILGNTTIKEMFHALRDDYLGTEYVASVYIDVTGQSFLGVGNPSDSVVTVDITLPEVNNYSLAECGNKTITFSLQGLEAKTLDFSCDITGAHIKSTGNVIAYVASFSLMGPSTDSDVQFMVEQLIPINHLGSFYIVVPYGVNAYGDVISLVTTQNNTFVHISGYDYAILPKRFGNIRRRLEGRIPFTVRSSKPVFVTQFALNAANKSVMVVNVPATFDTNVDSPMANSDLFYNFMNSTQGSLNDNAPLTRFYAYRRERQANAGVFACTIYKDKAPDFGGSFCGFSPSGEINYRELPLMSPGDGIDNDNDGNIDEDDCYTEFFRDQSAKDCKRDITGGAIEDIFILPILHSSLLFVHCGVDPVLPNAALQFWSTATWQTPTMESNMYRFNKVDDGSPLIIKTESTGQLSLMCNYVCVPQAGGSSFNCSNSFLVPPIRMLGTQYTTILPPCSEGSETCGSRCVISNIFNDTYVYVKGHGLINLGGKLYQQKIESPTAGSYIGASYTIAVICGSFRGNEDNALIHFLPPTDAGGYMYKIVKTEDFESEILHFVSTDENTVVYFSGNDTQVSTDFRQHFILQHVGSDAIVDIASDNNSYVYSFLSNKPVHVIAYIKQKESGSNTAGIPFNSGGYNFVHVPQSISWDEANGRSITEALAEAPPRNTSRSGYSHLSQLTPRHRPVVDLYQVPGDGVDNDKDGLVDEEYCGFLIEDIPTEESTIHDIDLDGSYNEDCKGCQGGYGLTPYLLCTICDFGTYRESHSNIDKCNICGENFTTFGKGSLSPDQCIPTCVEGMELDNNTMTCVPCPVGYYKNVSANDTNFAVIDRFRCKQCPGNKTTFDVGTVTSGDCIEHCVEGAELSGYWTCEACNVGFYKSISSADISASVEKRWNCTECDSNTTTFYKGTVQAADCITNCIEGMYLNGTECLACPVGFYKNTSSASPLLPNQSRWNCTACPAGTTTYSTRSSLCIAHCRNGYQLHNGICTPCDIGFYKNTSSEDEFLEETLRWNCTQCPPGQTTNSSGAETCIQLCPVGEEFNITTRSCVPCPLGFYKNISGSHVGCDICPVNYTTRHVRATSFHDCKLADCKCPCNRVHVIKNYTTEELATVIDEMKKELTVKKESLSANVRKKISVMDSRPSAKSLGSFGIFMLTFVFGLLIAFDFLTLKQHLMMFWGNLKNIFS